MELKTEKYMTKYENKYLGNKPIHIKKIRKAI